MAASTGKVSAKISALESSLDDLEAQLEPLFAQTLPESVVALEKIEQAKLQVALPYVVYDLVFIYLKTKGVDPKTHPVVAELDRIRQYFGKIKDAEDPAKRRLAVDKGVANRFIKHAIAQVKVGRPPGQDEGASAASGLNVRVPPKVTSKMLARAQYEKETKELGSEEEDDLEIIDDAEADSSPPAPPSKGKMKASAEDLLADVAETVAGRKRRRPAVDAFSGYDDVLGESTRSVRPSPSEGGTPSVSSPAGTPQPGEDSPKSRKTAKKARRKAKRTEPAS